MIPWPVSRLHLLPEASDLILCWDDSRCLCFIDGSICGSHSWQQTCGLALSRRSSYAHSCRSSKDQRTLKRILGGNYSLLSPEEKRMASTLVAAGQKHVFQHWPAPGVFVQKDIYSLFQFTQQ